MVNLAPSAMFTPFYFMLTGVTAQDVIRSLKTNGRKQQHKFSILPEGWNNCLGYNYYNKLPNGVVKIDEADEITDSIEALTPKQKKTFKTLILFLLLGLSILALFIYSFRAGGIYACEHSGGGLVLKPEFKCHFEKELDIANPVLAALYNNTGG